MISDNDCRFTNGHPHICLYCQEPIILNYTVLNILIKSLCLFLSALREQTFYLSKSYYKMKILVDNFVRLQCIFLNQQSFNVFFSNYILICLYFVCMHMNVHLPHLHVQVRGQLKSWFSVFTMCGSGFKLRLSGLVRVTFIH